MLNSIIAFSIRNKLIIGLFTIGLIVYGSFQFTLLPIDAVPDITDNQVQVITVTPSLGAPDVERLITFPIEQANSTPGPFLIDFRVKEEVNVYPMVPPGAAVDDLIRRPKKPIVQGFSGVQPEW